MCLSQGDSQSGALFMSNYMPQGTKWISIPLSEADEHHYQVTSTCTHAHMHMHTLSEADEHHYQLTSRPRATCTRARMHTCTRAHVQVHTDTHADTRMHVCALAHVHASRSSSTRWWWAAPRPCLRRPGSGGCWCHR